MDYLSQLCADRLKGTQQSITSDVTSLDHVDTSSSDEETTTINGEEGGLIHEFSPDSLTTAPSHEDEDERLMSPYDNDFVVLAHREAVLDG